MTDQCLKHTGLPLSYLHKSRDATTALTKKAFKDREERLRSPGGDCCVTFVHCGLPSTFSQPDVSVIPLGAKFIMETIFSPSKWCRYICDKGAA